MFLFVAQEVSQFKRKNEEGLWYCEPMTANEPQGGDHDSSCNEFIRDSRFGGSGEAYGMAEANFYLEKTTADERADLKRSSYMICSTSGRIGPK